MCYCFELTDIYTGVPTLDNCSFTPSCTNPTKKGNFTMSRTTIQQLPAENKKEMLLKYAEAKRPRPSRYAKAKHLKTLGRALSRYTQPKEESFDAAFTENIKTLRPDWFA